MYRINSVLGRMTLAVGFCLFVFLTLPALAEMETSGDVWPTTDPSLWNENTSAYIGYWDEGTLSITNGSEVRSFESYLGYPTGSTGLVIVDGIGSTWMNSRDLYVGFEGNGSLNITNGGTVSSTSLTVGYGGRSTLNITQGGMLSSGWSRIASGSGSACTVTVDGIGSMWNTDDLTVGDGGVAILNVTGGGAISSGSSTIGRSGLGLVTVDGPGSMWTNSGDLSIDHGSLSITHGGAVSNSYSDIDGEVTVDGAGSTWTNNGSLHIGNGRMSITNGGLVVSNKSDDYCVVFHSYIGGLDGSGVVTVDGIGSKWINNCDLYVGFEGNGKLNVTNGGLVEVQGDIQTGNGFGFEEGKGEIHFEGGTLTMTGSLLMGSTQLTGTGTINTHGLVSDGELVLDDPSDLTQTVIYNRQPDQNITINMDISDQVQYLGAGYTGNGSLTIRNGVEVSSAYGSIGDQSGSTGTVTVDGAGSMWISEYLDVGYYGSGTLNITNGGVVSSLYGGGIGGWDDSATGVVTVDGTGSTWMISEYLGVGYYGSGTLNITNGGAVSSSGGDIGGWGDSGTGVVTVDGVGSTWIISEGLSAGINGNATLTITNEGAVSSSGGFIGGGWRDSLGTGLVTVDGVGSMWTNSESLSVGMYGNGTLNITNGGVVSNNYGDIGAFGTGAVMVDGAGSMWTNSESLSVGMYGNGTLNITNGGLVSVAGTLAIDNNNDVDYGEGYINMTSGGMLALMGQADGSLADFLNLIDGTDAIRYWEESLSAWSLLSEATYGVDYTLEYLTEGDLAGYTVLTVFPVQPLIIPGDYNFDGVVDLADYTLWADHFGQTGAKIPGDGNDDGVVDISDYTLWADHFGQTAN